MGPGQVQWLGFHLGLVRVEVVISWLWALIVSIGLLAALVRVEFRVGFGQPPLRCSWIWCYPIHFFYKMVQGVRLVLLHDTICSV